MPPSDDNSFETLPSTGEMDGVREPTIDPLGPKKLDPEGRAFMDEIDEAIAADQEAERKDRVARMLGYGRVGVSILSPPIRRYPT